MKDRTTEVDAKSGLVPDGLEASGTINLTNDTDTSPQPFQNTVSQAATPSALLDFRILESGTDTVTYPQGFGPYELIQEIARGGMGVVFKAKQKGLDRIVALKMILGLQEYGNNAQRFKEEARAIAALDHPNVVPIFDIGEIGGRMYFTMPFISGPSLKAMVEKTGLPPIPRAMSLFIQITAGMAQAHRQGIMHRDLKPANVLVDSDGRPRVADFGLAKRAGDSERINITGTGQLMGTPAYMSPEQARDSKDVTPSTDVYSLGAILYFLLTGRAPFVGDTIPDLLIQVVSATPQAPKEVNPAVPDDVSALCMKCLAKLPGDRFPDAIALSDAMAPLADRYLSRSGVQVTPLSSSLLDSVSVGGATTLPSTSPDLPAPPQQPSKPAWLWLALPLLLLIGGAAAVAFWPRGEGKKSDQPIAGVTDPNAKPADPKPDVLPPPGGDPQPKVAAVVDDRTWPEPKADFRLTVDMVANAKKDAAGVVRLKNGSLLELNLKPEVDCWVYVFVVEQDDAAILLFPNKYENDNRLRGGITRVIPSEPNYGLQATPTEGPGVERVRVIASTVKLPDLPAGKVVGHFQQFADNVQKSNLSLAVRGIRGIEPVAQPNKVLVKKKSELAEAEVKFRVD
ncbi:serine/threonine-protein kinase [Limnoglobus roseus]|uniref:non-specific serine/threonine protein kinase n=1 Tax=Limnoglobus roseus TaxID=2598579 RepID=A0A5C1A9U8_9BACT|nr:serine/threonine-protein kinase [Limnoglobus roseus]QEL14582.1 hypothetical protein PX52LOC_01472 [Limnoglobus roseus]